MSSQVADSLCILILGICMTAIAIILVTYPFGLLEKSILFVLLVIAGLLIYMIIVTFDYEPAYQYEGSILWGGSKK